MHRISVALMLTVAVAQEVNQSKYLQFTTSVGEKEKEKENDQIPHSSSEHTSMSSVSDEVRSSGSNSLSLSSPQRWVINVSWSFR